MQKCGLAALMQESRLTFTDLGVVLGYTALDAIGQRATDATGLSGAVPEDVAALALILSSKAFADEKTLASANGPLATRETSSWSFGIKMPIGVEDARFKRRIRSRNWDGVASPTDRTAAY